MNTLRKYLISEFLKHFVPVEIFFLTVFTLSDFFWRMRDFIEYKVHFTSIIYYLSLNLPLWTVQILPLSVMLSTLLIVTHFMYTKEAIVIQTLGINIKKFFNTLLLIGAILSITSFLLHDKIATKLFNKADEFFHIKIKHEEKNTDFLNMLMYVSYNEDNLTYVFIEKYHKKLQKIYSFLSLQFQPEEVIYQIYSPEGEKDNLVLKLNDCITREFSKNTITKEKLFKEYNYKLPIDIDDFQYDFSSVQLDKWNIKELKHAAKILTYKGESTSRIFTEISFRYAVSFLNFILVFISIYLGQTVQSQYGKLTSFVYTIAALVIYWILLSFCKTLGELNLVNPIISVWIPNILFFSAGMLLYFKR